MTVGSPKLGQSKMSPDVPQGGTNPPWLVENRRTTASTVAPGGQPWGTENKGAKRGTRLCPMPRENLYLGSSPAGPAPAGSLSSGCDFADSQAYTDSPQEGRGNESTRRGPSPEGRQDLVEKSQASLTEGWPSLPVTAGHLSARRHHLPWGPAAPQAVNSTDSFQNPGKENLFLQ